MNLKTGCVVGLLLLGVGCTSVRTIPNGQWNEVVEKNKAKGATLYIGESDITCKIIEVSPDSVIIEYHGQRTAIPSEAVSRVVIPFKGSKNKVVTIGGASGLVVGAALGSLFKSQKSSGATDTLSSSSSGTPVIVGALLGTAAGMWAAATFFAKDDSYEMNPPLKKVQIHPALGTELTPADLKAFKLFDDLVSEKEKLLRVQIFQMTGGRYFIVYDVAVERQAEERWKIVDEAYLDQQKQKLKI